MSKEWAHVAARKEVPTEMECIIHDGYVLMSIDGCALARPAGTVLRGAVQAQLVQDKSSGAYACPTASFKVVVARPRTTLQKNPFMTRGAVVSGASSGPHRAWDPV
jgi:hypothetical protein